MNIKKIAILHPTFGYNGGAENVILSTAKSLHNINIETDIYTYKLRDKAPDFIKQFKTDIYLNPLIFNKTAKYLANNLINYDAILIHNFPATIFYGLAYNEAKKNNNKLPKSFWYCHEPSVRLYGNDDKSYKKLQKTWDIIARWTMRLDKLGVEKIDYIMANSERTKNAIKRVYNREAKVIYPCITQNDIIPIAKSEHFIYVGRLEKVKGCEYLISALKRLKNVDYICDIYGDGSLLGSLKELAAGDDKIHFMGFSSEVRKLLPQYDVLVLPSLYEAFPLTIPEAMNAKVLLVCSNVGGIPYIIENQVNGYLFDMGNVEQLGTILESIAKNPKEQIQIIEQAYDDFKHSYTEEVMIKKTFGVLEEN